MSLYCTHVYYSVMLLSSEHDYYIKVTYVIIDRLYDKVC